jgi:uncharacterized ion transporter superfamily protein YfcC
VFFNLLVSEAFPGISPFHQNKLTSRVSFISINCIVCLRMYVYIGICMISVYFSVSYPSRIQKWNTVQSLFQAFRYFIKKLHQKYHLFISTVSFVYVLTCRYCFLQSLTLVAGLPDFSWSKHTKMGKFTKWMQTVPNGHKLYQMAVKHSKWS